VVRHEGGRVTEPVTGGPVVVLGAVVGVARHLGVDVEQPGEDHSPLVPRGRGAGVARAAVAEVAGSASLAGLGGDGQLEGVVSLARAVRGDVDIDVVHVGGRPVD